MSLKNFSLVFFLLWALAAGGILATGGKASVSVFLLVLPFGSAVLALVIVGILAWIVQDKPFSRKPKPPTSS